MPNLLDLPEEILIIIIKQLDTTSLCNLYETCHRLNHTVLIHGVIKVCNLSLNRLATAKSLQLNMVKQISSHLIELNMSAVSDLTKSSLLPAIKRMKCLKTLDISYTKITILDFLELYRSCPTIKNISMDYRFKNTPERERLTPQTIQKCQEVFENFVNVHFVLYEWFSGVPFYILKNSSINSLKCTICERTSAYVEIPTIDKIFPFNHISIFILCWEFARDVYYDPWHSLLSPLNIVNVEYIIIEYYNDVYSFCVSPIFTKFMLENFNITSFVSFSSMGSIHGNSAFLLWNKETIVFDELFFYRLKERLREIFVCKLEVSDEQPLNSGLDIKTFDQFHIIPVQRDDGRNRRAENTQPALKKSRCAPQGLLNYDNIFKEHKTVKLTMIFKHVSNVTLSANSDYLNKITYLSLQGRMVRYSTEFFNILFRCCKNLVTLNVQGSVASPCCLPIVRSIPLSKSIKNIRLSDKRIDFNMLFTFFSQCTSLENICIVDTAVEFNNLADPTALFQNCSNLYNLYIQVSMSEGVTAKKLQMFNTIKKKCCRHHVNFTLYNSFCNSRLGYNPYVHVFNLYTIKPV